MMDIGKTAIRFFAFALFFSLLGPLAAQDEHVKISGTVSDFDGRVLDGVSVILKDRQFRPLYETFSSKDGRYSLSVPKGMYYCLYAIRQPEYRVSRLEYWAWNVPAYEDMEINPRYDRMEIYGINVFEPQVTPQETYMVYFRPMSLAKTLNVVSQQKVDTGKFERARQAEKLLKTTAGKLVNISPEAITPQELAIEVNGVQAEILGITKTVEYGRGTCLYGYLVQIMKPKVANTQKRAYDRISITLRSLETGEIGMGEAFFRKP